jgi:hypothetical protein
MGFTMTSREMQLARVLPHNAEAVWEEDCCGGRHTMSEGKSIHEIHLHFVELLKARGEQVVQPRGEPTGSIKGYDKTIGLISAGTIAVYKQGGYTSELDHIEVGSTFDLLQDMLTHIYTGVKGENLGLCDTKCWYEAIEDKRQERAKVNREAKMMKEDDYEKEIITIVIETDQGFNVYAGIGAKEADKIGIPGLQKREPDLFTPDLYKAVKFADEYVRTQWNIAKVEKVHRQSISTVLRIVFILGEAAGVHRQEEKTSAFTVYDNSRLSEEEQEIVERVNPKPALAELCINIGDGQAVISPEGNIEFNNDTGMNISLRDLNFVIKEAEAYMKYREERADAKAKAD